jgi:hypothetical protein
MVNKDSIKKPQISGGGAPRASAEITSAAPRRAAALQQNYFASISGIQIDGVCLPCKELIASKMSSGKYKKLRQPAKCTDCHQKTVHHAYYARCRACAQSKLVCARCGDSFAVKGRPKAEDNEIREISEKLESGLLREREVREPWPYVVPQMPFACLKRGISEFGRLSFWDG